MFAFERDGKTGFIDRTGRIFIPPILDTTPEAVGDFHDGLARIGAAGYITESGRWFTKADRETVTLEDFSDGMAVIRRAAGYTYLTTDGKEVPAQPAGYPGRFSEGRAHFETEPKPPTRTRLHQPGLMGFMDKSGKVVIEPKYADVGPFQEGLARVVLDGYCHIAVPEGRTLGTPTTGLASSCGSAPEDADTPCKVGFVNLTGDLVIRARFESARDFQEGLAAVRLEGRWGFIDTRGNIVIQPRFEQVRSVRNGRAAFLQGKNWGYIDRTGRIRVAPRFAEVTEFSEGLAAALIGNRWVYIDENGATSLRQQFVEAPPFVQGLAAVRRADDDRVSYIDRAGRTAFEYTRTRR